MTIDPETPLITTRHDLEDFCRQIQQERFVAFDLEADSLHHYTEKVCLMQVSTATSSAIIDPLAFRGMEPLAEVLADSRIVKILHGADYDIRSLHRDFAIEVNNLFDTMVACQFLGEKETGLAAVLRRRFGVELDKKYQKADWSRRPLDAGMIAYAITDTKLLINLHHQLERELKEAGRLSWVEEECLLLSRVRSSPKGDAPLFLRFKGSAKLDPLSLQVLEDLLQYRDAKARQRDLPPFKIMSNETLLVLTLKKPVMTEELKDVQGLSPKLIDRYGREILNTVAGSMAVPAQRLPRYPREARVKRDANQESMLKKLKEWRECKKSELGIEGGILANNALLEQLAEKRPRREADFTTLSGIKKWQMLEFGKEWLEIIR